MEGEVGASEELMEGAATPVRGATVPVGVGGIEVAGQHNMCVEPAEGFNVGRGEGELWW